MHSLADSSSQPSYVTFSFRPHHFLCTLGFQGKGYSPPFIKNYQNIVDSLQENEETLIKVTRESDSICGACPHNKGKKCATEDKIQSLDHRHSHILNLNPGDIVSWQKAKQRIKDRMTDRHFHLACAGCEWKSLGVCENALKDLRKS